ncbi:MAG: hypothetical protein PQJ44_03045, partial [Sphaerochaetaceae bacterium]|nr:hypothetical protein [Sphaerochaetaceae bacterium]
LKNGRKWNDISADEIEATKLINRAKSFLDNDFFEAIFSKLKDLNEFDTTQLKDFLHKILEKKEKIDNTILEYYQKKVYEWLENSHLHLLQKKTIEKLVEKFF